MASIRERTTKAGERSWSVLYRVPPTAQGKQTSVTFTDEKKANAFRANVDAHGHVKALAMLNGTTASALTVAELAERFLSAKEPDLTPRTMTDYRRDYTNWVEPWFGHLPADDVDERAVQDWVDHMRKRRLSPKSIADRHMLLHSMFAYGKARSRRLVEHNPCLETELPKRTKRPPKGTTVPEFDAILDAARRRNPDAHDLILFLGETGWRWSEAAALAVRDVDDDGDNVWATVSRVFRIDGVGRQFVAEDEAKSFAAFRRIVMFPTTAAMLRRRVVGKAVGDLVFTNSRGGPWNQNTFLRDTWPKIIHDAALDDRHPTPHWLRHMHVAVCDAAEMTPTEISRRLGHSNVSITMGTYGGLIGGGRSESVARAAQIMSGQRHAPGIAPMVRGELV